jgi:NADPH2:quinone reductase
MRAWLMDGYDGVEKLRLGEAEEPRAARGEVVLKLLYAALNPADAFLAKAQYPAKPALPHILGRDGLGEVVAVGEGVDGINPGDLRLILRCGAGVDRPGTLAERVAVPAASLARVPSGWRQEEAAGAPLVFLSAWQAITQWSEPAAPPAAGQVLLATGASGGVGSAAVLLGKSLGLTVVALSRDAAKGEELRKLGADHVFDPGEAGVRKKILAALGTARVDLAVDTVGGAGFELVIALLGYGGKISVVGRSGGPVPEFNTATLLFRRNRIGGVSVGDYTAEQAQEAWFRIVGRLDSAGRRPLVDHVFAFEEVRAAFARLAEGPLGKVVVRVG